MAHNIRQEDKRARKQAIRREKNKDLPYNPRNIYMRPDAEPYHPPGYRDYSGESRAALMAELGIEMAYKRANGKTVMKAAPST